MLSELLNYCAYAMDAAPRWLFRAIFPETPKSTDAVWTKYEPLFTPVVRLIDGSWAGNGMLWRRRGPDGTWQYRQDPETLEEWSTRQW